MKIEELKEHLNKIILLREEIKGFEKTTGHMKYSLSYYVNHAYEQFKFVDHGERDRFFSPQYSVMNALQMLMDVDEKIINSAFSKHKAKLLSVLNNYIKEMQLGFLQHDLELKSSYMK